jgi:hypothetical protein
MCLWQPFAEWPTGSIPSSQGKDNYSDPSALRWVSWSSRYGAAVPYNESGSGTPLYFSFDLAGMHAVFLTSYTDFAEDSPQYGWLLADLAKCAVAAAPPFLQPDDCFDSFNSTLLGASRCPAAEGPT